MPLQLISPKPCDFFFTPTAAELCVVVVPNCSSTTTLVLNRLSICSCVMPQPLSETLISTASSVILASTRTWPPEGVKWRAFSVSVLSMKSVSVRSAFTTACVGTTSKEMFFKLNSMRLLSMMSKSCCKRKLSTRAVRSPRRSFIHCVRALLYSLIFPASSMT